MTYPVGTYTYVENQERKSLASASWRLGRGYNQELLAGAGWGRGVGARTVLEMMTLSDAHHTLCLA